MAITLNGFDGFSAPIGNYPDSSLCSQALDADNECGDAGEPDDDGGENGFDASGFSDECDNGDEEDGNGFMSALAATWGEPAPMPSAAPTMQSGHGNAHGKSFQDVSQSIHQYAQSVKKQSFEHHLSVEKKHLDARGSVAAGWARVYGS